MSTVICGARSREHFQCLVSYSEYEGCGYWNHVGEFNKFVTYPPLTTLLVLNVRTKKCCWIGIKSKTHFSFASHSPTKRPRVCFSSGIYASSTLGCCSTNFEIFFSDQTVRLRCRMGPAQLNRRSSRIIALSKSLPTCFPRKVRKLSEFVNYKAVEFRILILCFYPDLLKK